MTAPMYRDPNYNRAESDAPLFERWRVRAHTFGAASYRCPACLQRWSHWRGLARHMAILHHKCRFCPKAYILVDQHEKRSHTGEYAAAEGLCPR